MCPLVFDECLTDTFAQRWRWLTRESTLVGVLVDIGGDLGLQSRRQHLPGPITDDLIQQRPAITISNRRVGTISDINYVKHQECLPASAATLT